MIKIKPLRRINKLRMIKNLQVNFLKDFFTIFVKIFEKGFDKLRLTAVKLSCKYPKVEY